MRRLLSPRLTIRAAKIRKKTPSLQGCHALRSSRRLALFPIMSMHPRTCAPETSEAHSHQDLAMRRRLIRRATLLHTLLTRRCSTLRSSKRSNAAAKLRCCHRIATFPPIELRRDFSAARARHPLKGAAV